LYTQNYKIIFILYFDLVEEDLFALLVSLLI